MATCNTRLLDLNMEYDVYEYLKSVIDFDLNAEPTDEPSTNPSPDFDLNAEPVEPSANPSPDFDSNAEPVEPSANPRPDLDLNVKLDEPRGTFDLNSNPISDTVEEQMEYEDGMLFDFSEWSNTPSLPNHVHTEAFDFGPDHDPHDLLLFDEDLVTSAQEVGGHTFPSFSGTHETEPPRGFLSSHYGSVYDVDYSMNYLGSDNPIIIDNDMLLERAVQASIETYSAATVPANSSAIRNLDNARFYSDLSARDAGPCAICLDEFEPIVKATRLPCSHVYHGDCIVPWLNICHQCPTCRFPLPHGGPILAYDRTVRPSNHSP